jgi:hypothetical protein
MSLLAVLVALQAVQPAAAALGEIRMHLFYEETGRLSPDISPPRDFSAWNTVIGGGEAEEPANDLLVVVEIKTEGQQNVSTPLRVVARGGDGRLLGERRFTGALTSEAGRVYSPLWLRDATCAGEIRVTATFGSQSRSETLSLHCGE